MTPRRPRSVPGCGRSTALYLLTIGLLGCGLSQLSVPTLPTQAVPNEVKLHAAVAQVDITPPLGLGMFGHGPESRVATGVALRLRCQVFVLTGPSGDAGKGEVLALVPCDLPAPSLSLQRAVANKIAHSTPIAANRIALMATHTHFGPGHYLQASNYNGPFSGRRIGYDKQVVDLLARRIARGIEEAYGRLRPARVAFGYAQVPGVSRNRAMQPLRLNRSLPHAIATVLDSQVPHPEDRAVDQRLSLLRVDLSEDGGNSFAPRGVLAIFGVHPSVIGNSNSLYSGDLFGYATRHAAEQLSAAGVPVIVGLANGLEGDVTSARGDDSAREAQRLGHTLGDAIVALHQSLTMTESMEAGPIQVGYQELLFSGARLRDGRQLCEQAQVGTVSAGGANDHPTAMRVFAAARPGARLAPGLADGQCDPYKFPLVTPNVGGEPGADFPHVAPIMVARLGGGVMALAPAELTTVTGMRIAQAISERLPAELASPVTMVGLTNEYLLYVATADEYTAQHYEGAATVYGPNSAEFLREQFICLSGHLFADTASMNFCQPDQTARFDAHVASPYSATFQPRLLPAAGGRPGPFEADKVEEDCMGDRCVFTLPFTGPRVGQATDHEHLRIAVYCGQALLDDDDGERLWLRYDDRATGRPFAAEWHTSADVVQNCGAGLRFWLRGRHVQPLAVPFEPGGEP